MSLISTSLSLIIYFIVVNQYVHDHEYFIHSKLIKVHIEALHRASHIYIQGLFRHTWKLCIEQVKLQLTFVEAYIQARKACYTLLCQGQGT